MDKTKKKRLLTAFIAFDVLVVAVVAAIVLMHSKKNDDSSSTGESSSVSVSSSEGSKDDGSQEGAGGLPVGGDDTSSDDSSQADSSSQGDSSSDADSSSNDDSSSKADSKKSDGYNITYSTNGGWDNSGVQMTSMELSIANNTSSPVSGWKLELEIDGLKSVDGWNGTWTASGDKLTITDADYNGEIPAGGAQVVGCNIGTSSTLKIKSAKLNGKECTVTAGKVDQNQQNQQNSDNNNNNNNGGNNNGGNNSAAGKSTKELLTRNKNAVQGDDWLHTDGNKILDKDGKQVWLTGVNWFGYNTGTNTFDGLWNSQLTPTVKAIADHGFNLIRVPISAELINQWAAGEYPQANYNNAYNEELNSMNSLEIFEYFLKLAEDNGLKVMIDIHSANTDASGHNANLWYTDRVSEKEYYAALEWMADRYKKNDTIIAFDLKNEPHGKPNEGDSAAIWNDSKDKNNWKNTAEVAAAKVLAKNPNVLIMVEGTEIYPKDIKKNGDYKSTDEKDYWFNWWGGNLRGVKDYPVDLGKYQDKLVYSPHDYGPTVYEQPWFEGDYDFDSLMKDCWKDNWFYIFENKTAPLLIGEWGGFMKEPNLTWMTYMRKLIKDNHLNHTFWCFNANSGDTGGLVLDDFTTWDDEKYKFVKEVLWQENGKFVGLDHAIKLGDNGISVKSAKGL
ncbi:MAG: cellulase family glycosylhydrolase [Ruminococcus sp.]|nr:cellulase family glycosylhydrolase [Ruminococcus sp.]